MTLTIEVAPDREARLRQKAARLGQSLSDYARGILERDADAGESAEDADVWSDAALQAAAERLAPIYAESLRDGGDLTALTTAPGDFHEPADYLAKGGQ